MVRDGSRHICYLFASPEKNEQHVKECLLLVLLTGLSFAHETDRESTTKKQGRKKVRQKECDIDAEQYGDFFKAWLG